MRRAPLAAALFVLAFTFQARAQATTATTPSAAGLMKENAELRAYAEKLEARIAELERANQKLKAESAARAEIRPFTPAPYGYQLPQLPFRPVPTPPPSNLRVAPAPSQPIPDTWRRHQFNGQEFYLVPLR